MNILPKVLLAITLVAFAWALNAKPVADVSRQCRAGADAAQKECAEQFENQHYDAGSINYLREDRIKDGPRCKAVWDASYYTCKGDRQ